MTLSDEQRNALNRMCPSASGAMLGDKIVELEAENDRLRRDREATRKGGRMVARIMGWGTDE